MTVCDVGHDADSGLAVASAGAYVCEGHVGIRTRIPIRQTRRAAWFDS